MFLSNQRKDQKETRQNLLAEKMVSAVIYIQRSFAQYLQTKSNGLSNRAKWVSLVGFVVLLGGISLWIVVSSLIVPGKSNLQVSSIQRPAYAVAETDKFFRLTNKLNQFKIGNPVIFDSLLTIKPGILDTLNIYETIFQKHQKELLWKRIHNRPEY